MTARTTRSLALAFLIACDGPATAPDGGETPQRDAGGGADAARSDAGARADGGTDRDAGTAPEGAVPMFVAVGWGGRRVMSCDLGRTWIADQQVAPEAEDDWHRPYTPKGLAYGDGTFVFLTGWGTNSTAHVSTNGIDWEPHALDTAYGGVGYDGDRFVLVGNRHLSASEDGGETWNMIDAPVPAYDRDADAFTGIWAAGTDGEVVTLRPGGEWSPLESCTGPRHGAIGHSGGFAAGLGVLVSFGDDGDTCVIDVATGDDLGAGSTGAPVRARPAFVGDAFWVIADGAIVSSTNGRDFTSRALPDGVDFDLVARAASGTYAGVSSDGARFYYSDDGVSWEEGEGPSGNGLVRMVFGYGAPSAECPSD